MTDKNNKGIMKVCTALLCTFTNHLPSTVRLCQRKTELWWPVSKVRHLCFIHLGKATQSVPYLLWQHNYNRYNKNSNSYLRFKLLLHFLKFFLRHRPLTFPEFLQLFSRCIKVRPRGCRRNLQQTWKHTPAILMWPKIASPIIPKVAKLVR